MYEIIFILLFCVIKGESIDFPDVSRIKWSYVFIDKEQHSLSITTDQEQYTVELICDQCSSPGSTYLYCKHNDLVRIDVVFKKVSNKFFVPVNATCNSTHELPTVDNIISPTRINSSQLTWTIKDDSVNSFVICYMDNISNYCKVILTNDTSYSLGKLKHNMIYQVCIAPITSQSVTGKYKCIVQQTDPLIEKPIHYDQYIRITKQKLNVFWSLFVFNDLSAWKIFVIFKDLNKNCFKSVQFNCKQWYQPINSTKLTNDSQRLNTFISTCPIRKDIELLPGNNTYYDTFDIGKPLRNISVEIKVINQVCLRNIYSNISRYKPIFNADISEILYHYDKSSNLITFFWRISGHVETLIFEYIIRITTPRDGCIQSINYICGSCDISYRKSYLMEKQRKQEWSNLIACNQTKSESFIADKKFFGDTIDVSRYNNHKLENVTMSIYGMNAYGVLTLY